MLRCGVDLITVERVADGLDRFGERFLQRIFTAGERQDCEDSIMRLAARLAGKEAVAKALGTGIGEVSWVEIEIRSQAKTHRPQLLLHGAAAEIAAELGLTHWDISLSHTREHAIAFVVASGNNESHPQPEAD